MRGGYRLGAGRKQGFAAKNAEEARRLLSEMVVREIAPIGEALIAKAKRGDIRAVHELFDRAFGKSPVSELPGEPVTPFIIQIPEVLARKYGINTTPNVLGV